MMRILSRRGRSVALLAAALTLAAGVAEARVGGGRSSFGSRGARTWSAPPTTKTAPAQTAPIQRSQTPNAGPQMGSPAPNVAQPRRFGFGTGLAAGLFGAGLLGLLMGNGFFGGLAGLGSILGLVVQLGLIYLLARFAIGWFRRRNQPAYAGAGQGHARSMADGPTPPRQTGLGSGLGSGLGAGLGSMRPQQSRKPGVRDEIGIGEQDYAAFEKTLVDVQTAYSRSDIATIWQIATPEMAGYIQEELSDNAQNGVVNTVSRVRLVQGDLAEAWREGHVDFATVAMRYEMTDVTKDKSSGRIVDGDPEALVQATEIWTFRREPGTGWKISAIQQTQ